MCHFLGPTAQNPDFRDRKCYTFTFCLRLSLALSDSLSGSLPGSLSGSLALSLGLWLPGYMDLSLALSGSIWLTRPLLGSQRRCCVVILYPTLHAIRIQISGSGYQYPVINSHQYDMKICIPHRIHACKRCYAHFKVHASSKYVH